ncbi:MAG TPA: hypothetical protein VHZ56_13275 [Devosia sp.]|nr:hypothetical protein [Devosia sp.]
MKITRVVSAAAITVSVAGCATLPDPVPQPPVKLDEIFNAVDCEVVAGLAAHPDLAKAITPWKAGLADLQVSANDSFSSSPGLTWGATATGGAKLSAKWGAGASNTLKQSADFQHDVPLRSADPKCLPSGSPMASTGLDIANWLASVDALRETSASDKALDALTYDRTFTVTRTAGGGLSFQIYGVSVGLDTNSIGRSDIYELTLAIKKPEAKKANPEEHARLETQIYTERLTPPPAAF